MGPKSERDKIHLAEIEDSIVTLSDDIQEIRDMGLYCSENPQKMYLFKARLSKLDHIYDEFQKLIREAKSLGKILEDVSISRFDEMRLKTRNIYYEALSLGVEEESMRNPSSFTNTSASKLFESRVKLPAINLPIFDGQISKWISFRDTFMSLIHNNVELSEIQKFHYLNSSLKGSALQSISAILTTSDGYQQAWATLVQRYDNKRIHATNYLINIFNFKPITKFDYRSLEKFVEVVMESATAFRNMNLKDPSGFILFTFCLKLLDHKTRERFESEFASSSEIPTFDDFSNFIQRQCLQLQTETLTSNIGTNSHNIQPFRPAPTIAKRVLMSRDIPLTDNNCPLCPERHRLYRCPLFRTLEPRERFDKLKPLNLCHNCLKPGHYSKKCLSPVVCHYCKKRHHSLLHFPTNIPRSKGDKYENPNPTTSTSASHNNLISHVKTDSNNVSGSENNIVMGIDEAKNTVLSSSSEAKVSILLGTAWARVQDRKGRYVPIRILIDSGSQRSFISLNCAQNLGLKMHFNPQALRGFGDSLIKGGDHQTRCILVPQNCLYPRLETNAVVVSNITDSMPTCPIPTYINEHFRRHYNLADNLFGKPGPVDFLLGADLFGRILTGRCIDREGYPSALQTIFGWVIIGPIGSPSTLQDRSVSLIATYQQPDDPLNKTLEKFWEVEAVPEASKVDPDNVIAEDHFRSTHSRDSSGRYIVRLPFKDPVPPNLGSSYKTALTRFMKLEHRLNKIPSLKENYSKIIKEYLELGYVSQASSPGKYYLPHHCVVKDNSFSKVRIVFDASSSTEFGSLNDHLLIGPKLQLDIKNVLLNFRRYPIVIASDICQMFLQILIHKEDIPYQHFLYRSDVSDPIVNYQLNRVTFGLSCSPFLAIRVLHQLIVDEGSSFPRASEVLKNNIYVDDILAGADTVKEALELQYELRELLKKGGFTLKKWMSNTPELLSSVTDRQEMMQFSEPDNKSVKLLGIQWDSVNDCLSYDIQSFQLIMTKRGIMSAVARMYDPLGYLAPVTFKAKLYLQDLWTLKDLSWDCPLPEAIAEEYREFFGSLKTVRSIRIPRCIFPQKPIQVTLVGFADASERGYAATIYLRVQLQSGHIETHLIISKTRLAPLKTISIPKLELCAALLLAQTKKSISDIIKQSVDSTYLFSDSSIVLSWLRLSPHTLKTFVANRVSQILEISVGEEWYHVSSNDNPADLPSRGLLPSDLIDNRLWWHGPEWLLNNFSEWPNIHLSEPVPVPELKSKTFVCISQSSTPYLIDVMERFSSFGKLTRVFSYVIRFIRNLQVPSSERRQGPLSNTEIAEGTRNLIRCVQNHYFPTGSIVMRSIQSLSPFFDKLGVLRVGGRLKYSPLPYDARHPIILPQKAHFTELLIDHYHRIYLHAGPQLLHSLIIRSYWIVSARRVIRHRVHKCMNCYRFRSKTFTPYMSDLPPSRFEQGRPFLMVGVDFAGPFLTKESNRRKSNKEKSYVCLFVCLSTRAVHLELVSQLTTDAFIACLDRFVSRRGLPIKILSDNGTNFLGASRYLKDVYDWLHRRETQNNIKSHCQFLRVEWEFIPPSAPHFGGVWEAGVKSFKHHLYRVIKDHILTFEEMTTLLTRIEAVLNSRPLYPLSSSPENLDVLTPGHFIIGTPLVAVPEHDFVETPMNRLTRWQLLQKFTQDIWNRWRRDYLNSLQQRVKWSNRLENVKPNDLVLLRESNVPPLQWPRGRVVEVHPGPDGTVRVVRLRTSKGELVRPVTKLAPLLSPD